MDKRRDEQTAQIYARIGQYVVEYSQLIHELKIMLAHAMAETPPRQPAMNDVVDELSDQALVRVLGRYLHAPEFRSPGDRKIIDEILGRIAKAENDRNQFLHSVWFVGWGNEQTSDWSKADRIKAPRKRKLGAIRKHTESAESIIVRVRNLCELREDAMRLVSVGLIPFPGYNVSGKIERNFVCDTDGRFRPPREARQKLAI